ncbi:MAG: trypsin-like peptidase domain-containing protein [Roseomonas sp.]|nr:trypsin-like peptidase domain-containing protein [Roseomonas sp.]MCA3328372.1 trypsin-like peptidase domain-containing protein [Roseomonas sp.]MCA3330832.1 trypsin-like peptidase domain-containing protein [Roseomonas sp.]MCA3334321.1 trypsin-like peptidase domain-containing protein [Roseomonas sp.]MCA3348290.1 trypsin-like peptidase domain-containing protein [Roseomonas sp.]
MRALLPALMLLILSSLPALPQTEPVRILNQTELSAHSFFAVQTGRQDWGSNLLTRGPLQPGAELRLRPAQNTGCRFDLRMVLSDGREIINRGMDICAEKVVAMQTPLPRPPGAAAPAPGAPPQAGRGRASTGTGFVVARDRVLTNHHVIDGCNAINIRTADGRTLPATMPARVDVQRDLALLAVPNDPGPVLPFRANPVRRGESVVTYGFPLAGLLAAGPTLTTGEVSALAGLANNEQHFQISAPVQQGNSGGPLLDRQGHVMGVIVSKLNAQRIAQRTGDIPQNVNFAVKGTEALGFLRRAGVEPTLRESAPTELSAAEVGERAHPSTVFIRCEK